MKMEELKGKQVAELKALMLSMKKELFNLRFQRAAGELTNTARFREVRKDIARVQTALRQNANSSNAA
jgi:large subunit ribosomal protein L29